MLESVKSVRSFFSILEVDVRQTWQGGKHRGSLMVWKVCYLERISQ